MGARFKFDDATSVEIVDKYLQGVSAHKLSVEYGCQCWTILKLLRRFGIETRKHAVAYAMMSKEDRILMTTAAHAAKRGKPMKESSKIRLANTVEKRGGANRGIPMPESRKLKLATTNEIKATVSALEERFIYMLTTTATHIDWTPQKAVGIYNIDIALTHNRIAVEIFGGNWHATGRHAARYRPRIECLLSSGWLPVIIWVTRSYPLTQAAVDYVVSLHEVLCTEQADRSEEHVIWGTGEFIPVAERDPVTGARKTRFDGYNKSRHDDGRFRR